ncbi:Fur family transcriptional regulator [Nitratireductor rhodophyticola]|uniref:Fur family transcriptional regulator n=1 Tax=Nitratireductor rhodophyticola TaxID=2854036 RepID=UPI00300AB750
MTNRIETACRERGIKLTGQRKLIAEVLSGSRGHPDVPELHRRVTEHNPRISLSTVYRTLKRLEQAGILERHTFLDGRDRYEDAGKKHHDRLIDMVTGKVIEFSSPEIERLQSEIASDLGFRLVGHRLELYGEPLDQASSSSAPDHPRKPR